MCFQRPTRSRLRSPDCYTDAIESRSNASGDLEPVSPHLAESCYADTDNVPLTCRQVLR